LEKMLKELKRSEPVQWEKKVSILDLEALGCAASNMGFALNDKAPKNWCSTRIHAGVKRESTAQFKLRFMKNLGFEAQLKRKYADLDTVERNLETQLEDCRRKKKLKVDLEASTLAYKQAQAPAKQEE